MRLMATCYNYRGYSEFRAVQFSLTAVVIRNKIIVIAMRVYLVRDLLLLSQRLHIVRMYMRMENPSRRNRVSAVLEKQFQRLTRHASSCTRSVCMSTGRCESR